MSLPAWFKQELPDAEIFKRIKLLSQFKINTVCQQAKCPNLNHCFKKGELSLLILGDTCTRACRFCAVAKSENRALSVDKREPQRIGRIARGLGLKYVVITSVTRDDLDDAGAGQFAATVRAVRRRNKNIKIEVLIPDFSGKSSRLKKIVDSKPQVIAHNLETVRRLSEELRPQAGYELSLGLLKNIKKLNSGMVTKSSLMLGLGETEAEVIAALKDLRSARCDILTIGQYLAPSNSHYPVSEFIEQGKFREYAKIALALGFKAVLSGPLVRSSYKAEDLYRRALDA